MSNETAYGEIDENISIVQSNKKFIREVPHVIDRTVDMIIEGSVVANNIIVSPCFVYISAL